MEGNAPQTPQFEQEMDVPLLSAGICRDAEIWGALHNHMPQEVRDQFGLKLLMLIGADIWG